MGRLPALSPALRRPFQQLRILGTLGMRTKSRERPIYVLQRFRLQRRGHVGIGVGRNADLGVPENLLNHSELDSRREQERRARVTRIVETLVR